MRAVLVPLLAALACGAPPEATAPPGAWAAEDTSGDQAGPPAPPRLYPTCGDPVCRGWSPHAGVPRCGAYTAGDRCPTFAIGRTCDPQDPCNALLECRRDPDPGPCPISRVAHKRDVAYLDDPALRAAAAQILDTKLATWGYTWDDPAAPLHLGFLIDDQPTSPAVAADGEHVDLYGYTSLAVAALQVQQATLDAQQAEIRELRARLARLEAQLAR
jgi:hypothetical protein